MPRTYNNAICSVTPGCTRKQRYMDGGCGPCHFRTVTEGTAKKFHTAVYLRRVEMVKRYNKLIRKGMRPHEIATLWGLDRKQLATEIYRAKRFSGLKVISAVPRNEPKPAPAPTGQIRKRASGHGEGKKGKKGCRDECCAAVRRETWRKNFKNYYERLKQRQAAEEPVQPDEMT